MHIFGGDMTNLTIKHNPLIVPSQVSVPSPETAHRLLVLVSGVDADLTAITRRVWELAETTKANIKFLGLSNDAMEESGLRRRLATMFAMVNYDNVSAETEIITGKNWRKAVKSRCQPGDMVVCFKEQRAGLLQRPLSQILQADLDVPIYILSDLNPKAGSSTNWPILAAAWIGFTAIVLGFLFLQVEIYHLASNWATTLELLSTAVEFWLIWVWNNFVR
jgi:hypothetical protein